MGPFWSPRSNGLLKIPWLGSLLLLLSTSYVTPGESSPVVATQTFGSGQGHLNIGAVALNAISSPTSPARNGSKSYVSAYSPPSTSAEEQTLVKPSELTFKVNRFCNADVSLEIMICHAIRNRGDLPKKEKYFEKVQQAVFVNVSGEGDLRLEDLRALFPNLIVLSITQSRFSAASLINLQATMTSYQWESRAPLVPKSLLANPHFSKRLNLNTAFLKPTPSSSSSSRGGRSAQQTTGEDAATTLRALSSTTPFLPSEASLTTEETNEIFQADTPVNDGKDKEKEVAALPPSPQRLRRLVWPSVRHLNLSWNELTSEALPDFLGTMFPHLEKIDLSNNFLTKLDKIRDADWTRIKSIDISGNPLDCTDLAWVDQPNLRLLHPNQTLCDQPPHQNKAKPILKVLRLLKKVKDECRVNCSCDIAYIWEQNHVVHSKTVVNCSGRGFLDFPDPSNLPRPTDTLDLRNNSINSMSTFVDDDRYLDLNVMNLYLDDNQISSINLLESSEWFYHFQQFSIRRNELTEVPVYVLENVFRQNKRLLQIDLSSNKFKCDCSTVSNFKVWLLKYSNQIGHIEDVRCFSTKEQIRYMRLEEWCKVENGTELLDVLDFVSIALAVLIVVVIAKVYYDYWNFKNKGRLPWIVSKM